MSRQTHQLSGNLVVVNLDNLEGFQRELRQAAKRTRTEFRRALRHAGVLVQLKAKENAAFSANIPATIKVLTRNTRVRVQAGGKDAPEAAAFEHRGVAGYFRHPVFGNREVWVDQRSHPFLRPAAEQMLPEVVKAVMDGVDVVLDAAGFK